MNGRLRALGEEFFCMQCAQIKALDASLPAERAAADHPLASLSAELGATGDGAD